jgi:hypothetical protein
MGLQWAAIGNTLGEHCWELDGNSLGTLKEYVGNKGKMKRWNYIQTFVTIFHLFFGAWVYVVPGWAI